MKHKYSAMAVALLLAGCSQSSHNDAGRQGRGGPLAVEFMVAHPQPVDHTLTYSGTLLANEEIEVKPETTGRITEIDFTEGSFVEKGTLLIKTDDSELQAQLRQNTVQTELALNEWQRRKELLAAKGISQEEYDASRVKYEALAAAQDLLKAQIAKTVIRAPFSGITGLRQVSEGAVVNTSTVITTLQQTDPVKIEFSVPEQYAADLKPGVPISFTTEGAAGEWHTTLYAVEPGIDPATRTVKVRARCANPGRKLIPGGFARVSLVVSAGKEGLVIPARAIIPVLNGQQVYLVKEGKAVAQDVVLGRRNAEEVEITSGLQPGDTVVMSGLLQIKPGAPVMPKTKSNQAKEKP